MIVPVWASKKNKLKICGKHTHTHHNYKDRTPVMKKTYLDSAINTKKLTHFIIKLFKVLSIPVEIWGNQQV